MLASDDVEGRTGSAAIAGETEKGAEVGADEGETEPVSEPGVKSLFEATVIGAPLLVEDWEDCEERLDGKLALSSLLEGSPVPGLGSPAASSSATSSVLAWSVCFIFVRK